MVDTGKSYVAQQRYVNRYHTINNLLYKKNFNFLFLNIFSTFANSLWDLSQHFKEDSIVLSSLNKLIHSLQEMNKFHTILLDQASRTILTNLTAFIKSYVPPTHNIIIFLCLP